MKNEIRWQRMLGPLKFDFYWRSKKGWGRFGGGWNWKLGFQVGGKTILVSMLVCELTISRV